MKVAKAVWKFLKGLKTMAFAVAVAMLGILGTMDLTPLASDPKTLIVVAFFIAVLRTITDTPVGRSK